MKKFFLLFIVWPVFPAASMIQERNLLENSITPNGLYKVLAKGVEWVKLPTYDDRSYWESISAKVSEDIIQKGEQSRSFGWPIAKASYYTEFSKTGAREEMVKFMEGRQTALCNLVLAELVEGEGRFIPAVIDGVWAICEQSTWLHVGNLYLQKRGVGLPDPDEEVIDIRSSDFGAMLA